MHNARCLEVLDIPQIDGHDLLAWTMSPPVCISMTSAIVRRQIIAEEADNLGVLFCSGTGCVAYQIALCLQSTSANCSIPETVSRRPLAADEAVASGR